MTELENYLSTLRTFGVRPGLTNTQNAVAALMELQLQHQSFQ